MFSLASELPWTHTTAVFHLGDVVRKLRRESGLTLVQLSERASVSKTTLSGLERNGQNFERETLRKIAEALGTTEGTLYELLRVQQAALRAEIVRQLGREEVPGSPGAAEDESDLETTHEGSQEMPDPDQVHGMITALRFAPPERRDEFVQYCISYAIGLRRKRATGTDPNG